MKNDFEEIMAKRSDEDLVKIVSGPAEEYQPLALEAAKNELAKRNIPSEQIQAIQADIAQTQQIMDEKANRLLETEWKVLAFIFPGVLTIMFSGNYTADGYHRKARELVRWTLFGLGTYLGLIFILVLLPKLIWFISGF